MNSKIKNSIEKGNLILLLGAGATKSSLRKNKQSLFTGKELARFLSESFCEPYDESDTLGIVYASLIKDREKQLHDLLKQELMHCIPSKECKNISSYPWKRIYTLNIDDAFDLALRESPQHVITHRMKARVDDHDQTYSNLDYIKLNGSVDTLHEGLIFSPKEYAKNNVEPTPWYEQLARDFFSSHFLFIGTEINEPSFEYVLELFQSRNRAYTGISHVLTPRMSKHKESQLKGYGIEFVQGTLEDFSSWLSSELLPIPHKSSLAYANNPALADIVTVIKPIKGNDVPKWANSVVQINNDYMAKLASNHRTGEEHGFYKGFKPEWVDIRDGVHALTEHTAKFHSLVCDALEKNEKLVVILGQAGSGKLTALMNSAYKVAKDDNIPVFFIQYQDDLKEIIRTLNASIKSKFIVCFEKLYPYIKDISEIFYDNQMGNCLIMTTERKNDWARRSSHQLHRYSKTYDIDGLTESDAEKIILKIKEYGRWSRLDKMSPQQRIEEFMEKAKRQILIALLELTRGEGFECIIDNDYSSIKSEEEYSLLHIVGLATVNHVFMPIEIAEAAFTSLSGPNKFSCTLNNLHGIITETRGKLSSRHSSYIDRIFRVNVNPQALKNAIESIISSFLVYDIPFASYMNKNNYTLYKSIINHTFLKNTLREEDLIIDIYKNFEKPIFNDGHFWLQYGLALRDFGKHAEAYDKLLQSLDVYRQPFTIHAVALQEIILSDKEDSELKAKDLFASAKSRLESIDGVNRSDTEDHYPIVTLSEAHVKHTERFYGKEKAKDLASMYANDIFERNKLRQNKKLHEAWTRLSKYATGGTWIGKSPLKMS